MVVCACVWVGGLQPLELICLSLRGQQETGLCCPDGRWPLWRQPRFKLLPGPFENTSALLEWLAIWAAVPSRRPPLCQACCGRHEWEAWQHTPPSPILYPQYNPNTTPRTWYTFGYALLHADIKHQHICKHCPRHHPRNLEFWQIHRKKKTPPIWIVFSQFSRIMTELISILEKERGGSFL